MPDVEDNPETFEATLVRWPGAGGWVFDQSRL